jgi:hypothetical protein
MVEVKVNSGVCGFITIINVNSEDMQNAEVKIQTDCPNLKGMEKEIIEVDAFEECFTKIGGNTKVFDLAKKYCKHPGCPVSSAIIKGIEVECSLALPKDVEIQIKKL